MRYVKWLDQVSKDDIPLAGGKGANLGEMVQMGMPVPAGFVVTTSAFDRLMEINNLGESIRGIVAGTDVDDTQALLSASKKIKEMVSSQDFPIDIKDEVSETYKSLSYPDTISDQRVLSLISAGRELALVAVRSSATAEDLPGASFAGQQASFLNIKGAKELLAAVKGCWASLFEPRAIFYRAKHDIEKASIAVVVQKMVNSEKSGVVFTINPVTGEDNLVIEATWGLGEMLVSGQVTPDTYIVSREGRIVDMKIGHKDKMKIRDRISDMSVELPVPPQKTDERVLTDDEISSLAEYSLYLESYYGMPQDIEFAIERNSIKIVQTRAITAKGTKSDVKIDGNVLIRGLGASPGIARGRVRVLHGLGDVAKVEKGDIIVTEMTSPDLVPAMGKSAAIITDLGGANSHAAIVSREMGIPAIVGTKEATSLLSDGMVVTVDAYNGLVYEGEAGESIQLPASREEVPSATPAESIAVHGQTITPVKVNLVFPDKAVEVSSKADGVGLLRLEHMVTKSGIHPAKLVKEGRSGEYTNVILDGVRPIAQAFAGKPVWVRTLDARTDEFKNLEGGDEEPKEDNPMIGWHGIRRSLDQPEMLKAEFVAIKTLHEEGHTNVHVMIPFVISPSELEGARGIAREVGLPSTVKFGIMVETPAAALSIEDFIRSGIDFVSFGTNDLTMLTLGIDRNNANIAKLYTENHPSVIRMIEHVINVCKESSVETSICGEAGSNPEMVRKLVRMGIGSVSCNIDALDAIRQTVNETERDILKNALDRRSHEDPI